MNNNRKGILLNQDNDVKINVLRDASGKITRGMVVGDRKMQDAYMVFSCNQGDIKEDPILGANLVRMIRTKTNKEKMRKTIAIALERIGIQFEEIEKQVNF